MNVESSHYSWYERREEGLTGGRIGSWEKASKTPSLVGTAKTCLAHLGKVVAAISLERKVVCFSESAVRLIDGIEVVEPELVIIECCAAEDSGKWLYSTAHGLIDLKETEWAFLAGSGTRKGRRRIALSGCICWLHDAERWKDLAAPNLLDPPLWFRSDQSSVHGRFSETWNACEVLDLELNGAMNGEVYVSGCEHWKERKEVWSSRDLLESSVPAQEGCGAHRRCRPTKPFCNKINEIFRKKTDWAKIRCLLVKRPSHQRL